MSALGGSRLPRMAALDGVRGAALVAVLLFHSRFEWAQGGFLGVTSFFVLSGFLITSLLLRERDTDGRISLARFWERRARRLAPGVVVLLGLVVLYVAFVAPSPPRGIVGDAIASSTWVANWRFVLAERSYADLFSSPSPLEHMWSLAVEEQVYLLLPLIVMGLLGRRRANRVRLAIGLTLIVIASTVAAALLRTPGAAPLHEYYGTDARAAEPVVGALLALALVGPTGLRRLGTRARLALDIAGVFSLAGLAVLIVVTSQRSDALYRGGFLLAALLSAVVIAAATQADGWIERLLRFDPLVGIGKLSYGAYLFHWPVFLWLTPTRTGLDGASLFALRGGVTWMLAVSSFHLIEEPIRTGRRLRLRIAVPTWANASVGVLAVLALVSMEASAGAPDLLSGDLGAPAPPPVVAAPTATTAPASKVALKAGQPALGSTPQPNAAAPQNEMNSGPPAGAEAPPEAAASGALRVAIVGDSMASNLSRGLRGWAADRGDVITYSLATLGCPLSRGGTRRSPTGDDWPVNEACGWWADPSSDRAQYLAEFDPDVIVVQDAMNELPDRKIPKWSEYRHTGDPLFDRWLLDEYTALINTIAPPASGTKVLFLNAVCVDWTRLGRGYEDYADNGEGDRRVQGLRATANAVASAGATVADYYARLCPDGEFSNTVDGVDDARPDGYHLSDEASRAVADQWLGPLIIDTSVRKPLLS